MLAKVWKKVLLAICIIACIYNIMSKLVNRASLEANLQKANDGNTIFDFSSKDSKSNTSEIVDGVISRNVTIENTIDKPLVFAYSPKRDCYISRDWNSVQFLYFLDEKGHKYDRFLKRIRKEPDNKVSKQSK